MAASVTPSDQRYVQPGELIRFQFGDRDLVGRVIDKEWDASWTDPSYRYTVDVDGITYPVRQSDVEALECL